MTIEKCQATVVPISVLSSLKTHLEYYHDLRIHTGVE